VSQVEIVAALAVLFRVKSDIPRQAGATGVLVTVGVGAQSEVSAVMQTWLPVRSWETSSLVQSEAVKHSVDPLLVPRGKLSFNVFVPPEKAVDQITVEPIMIFSAVVE